MTVQTCRTYDKNGIKEEVAKKTERLMRGRKRIMLRRKRNEHIEWEWGECFSTVNSDKSVLALAGSNLSHTLYVCCCLISLAGIVICRSCQCKIQTLSLHSKLNLRIIILI